MDTKIYIVYRYVQMGELWCPKPMGIFQDNDRAQDFLDYIVARHDGIFGSAVQEWELDDGYQNSFIYDMGDQAFMFAHVKPVAEEVYFEDDTEGV